MFLRQRLKSWSSILSWCMYDLANQFFAVNVVSLYFVRWLTIEKNAPEFFYSISFGISIFAVAVLAPFLGAISDESGKRKPFLSWLTLISVIFTILLGVGNSVFLALLFFAIANFGCQLAVVFYNTLLVDIAPKNRIGLVSGLGRMLGYTGAIIALYLIKPVVLKGGLQAAFLPTGMLFLLFSLPCLLFIKDRAPKSKVSFLLFTSKNKLLVSLKQLKSDFTNSHSIPLVPNFLKSAFLGLCVVNVIILFMSVYATRVFQLNEAQIVQLVTFSTFFAIFGSFLCGFLSDYIRIRPGLIGIFILWSLSLYLGSILRSGSALFLLVGALVGFSLGATWVVLRAFTLRLVPAERVGALFGLFNLIGSLSALTGALFWGVILLFLSPFGDTGYRIALLSLNIFFAFAVVFALRIKEK